MSYCKISLFPIVGISFMQVRTGNRRPEDAWESLSARWASACCFRLCPSCRRACSQRTQRPGRASAMGSRRSLRIFPAPSSWPTSPSCSPPFRTPSVTLMRASDRCKGPSASLFRQSFVSTHQIGSACRGFKKCHHYNAYRPDGIQA